MIREEQFRLAFPQAGLLRFFPLIAVAHQLLEGFVHRVRREVVGVLGLNDRQRQTVHKQHDVRDDEVLDRPRRVDAKLVDGEEVIPFRVIEVDQLDIRVLLAGDFVDIDLRPIQQLQHRLVRFHKALRGLVQNLIDQVAELLVGQPVQTFLGAVDFVQALLEDAFEDDLPEAGAQALRRVGRHSRPLINHLPIEGGELVEERLFDEGVFIHSLDHFL